MQKCICGSVFAEAYFAEVYFAEVYFAEVYFCKMYPTCVSSKLPEFIFIGPRYTWGLLFLSNVASYQYTLLEKDPPYSVHICQGAR